MQVVWTMYSPVDGNDGAFVGVFKPKNSCKHPNIISAGMNPITWWDELQQDSRQCGINAPHVS